MSDIIRMSDFRNPWKEACSIDAETSTLQVYVNHQTGEVEIVQMNDEGDAIRTQVTTHDAIILRTALTLAEQIAERKAR